MIKHPRRAVAGRLYIFPEDTAPPPPHFYLPVPPPPSSPIFIAWRRNPHTGTDRLTNKVNKYFPPLLKANQILILEVWSAEKKKKRKKKQQQIFGGRELIELILSLVSLLMLTARMRRERKVEAKRRRLGLWLLRWNCK